MSTLEQKIAKLEDLEKNIVRGDLNLTNVPLIRRQINFILQLRYANRLRPISLDEAKSFEKDTDYIRTHFPTLYKSALQNPDLSDFLRHLNDMLILIEKTQKNQMEYKEMTRIVGQTMFDKYVKPNVSDPRP